MQNWDPGGIFRPGKAELIQGAMIRKDGQGLSCPITHFFFFPSSLFHISTESEFGHFDFTICYGNMFSIYLKLK